MISILEMIGWVITIIPIVIFKATTLPVVINSGIVYLILLPRVFLMNTSHNKTRIIEHGWKNVLRNTFGISSSPQNPDRRQEKETSENKIFRKFPKGKPMMYQYNRSRINPRMVSRDIDMSLYTGSAKTSKAALEKSLLPCHGQRKKQEAEIMLSPEGLEGSRQTDRTIIILGSAERPLTKTNRDENSKLTLIDLEQEGEDLFSCK